MSLPNKYEPTNYLKTFKPSYESVDGTKHKGPRKLTLQELERHLSETLYNKAMLEEEMRLVDERIKNYRSLIAAYENQPDIRDYTSKPE